MEQRIRPVDLIIWDERRSGMMITDLTAYIRDGGVVEIPEYMIRGDARAEVLDQIEAVKVAMLAASNAITWPEDGADHAVASAVRQPGERLPSHEQAAQVLEGDARAEDAQEGRP